MSFPLTVLFGYAFAEMSNTAEAQRAISEMNLITLAGMTAIRKWGRKWGNFPFIGVIHGLITPNTFAELVRDRPAVAV